MAFHVTRREVKYGRGGGGERDWGRKGRSRRACWGRRVSGSAPFHGLADGRMLFLNSADWMPRPGRSSGSSRRLSSTPFLCHLPWYLCASPLPPATLLGHSPPLAGPGEEARTQEEKRPVECRGVRSTGQQPAAPGGGPAGSGRSGAGPQLLVCSVRRCACRGAQNQNHLRFLQTHFPGLCRGPRQPWPLWVRPRNLNF